MDALTCHGNNKSEEMQGLRRALDHSYAEMRARALTEWQRRRPAHDPSDACVRVRISESPRRPRLAK